MTHPVPFASALRASTPRAHVTSCTLVLVSYAQTRLCVKWMWERRTSCGQIRHPSWHHKWLARV